MRRALAALGVAAALAGCGGEGGGGAVREGLYLGDAVSFRVVAGRVEQFRFSGLQCRVPHPANPALVACLVRAPGVPAGALALDGATFAGDVGGVVLTGALTGATAEGTWALSGACPDASLCADEGTWTATWRPETAPPDAAPADTGAGPGDAGPLDAGPLPDTAGPGPLEVPEGATAAQVEAAERLAEVRARIGLPAAPQLAPLNAAAQAHADYYALHLEAYAASSLSPHRENPAWPEGFTGETAGDRLAFQGAPASAWGEVMAFTGSAGAAVDGWMETLYHRVPLVHPDLAAWGFGNVASGPRVEVADVTFARSDDDEPARWPPPGADDVARSWNGLESPRPPLPAGESYPSGPVITLTFPRHVAVDLAAARLVDGAGAEVPSQVQSPDNDPWLDSTWALYPFDPLAAGETWTVTFEGRAAGVEGAWSWSFTTR